MSAGAGLSPHRLGDAPNGSRGRWARAAHGLLRVGLGAVLIAAGALKLADPNRFASDIANFQLLPALAPLFAAVLPTTELVAGGALLLLRGGWQRAAAFVATVLFAMFSFAVGWAYLKGIDVNCGCFGGGAGQAPIDALTLLRNAALLGSAVALTVWPRR